MSLTSTLYAAPPLRLTVSASASPATVALLEQTTYGTHGPQYRHTGQARKIPRLTKPYFFELWHDAGLAGTYCLSERQLSTPAGLVRGFYGRYLSVAPAYQGRGYGQLLKQQAVQYLEQLAPAPCLFYSYIEASNERSLRISQAAGFQVLGQLEAFLFGRLYPRPDARMRQLTATELAAFQPQLAATYRNWSLVHFNQLDSNYFVLRENETIVAGVQAHPTEWRIEAMPELSGWALLHVLPHLPVLKRLINPRHHAFAALEAVYVQPGHEAAHFQLLESVLAHFRCTSALLLLDPNAPLSSLLRNSGQLGLLQALNQPVYTQVLAKLHGVAAEALTSTPTRPLYASAFDYT